MSAIRTFGPDAAGRLDWRLCRVTDIQTVHRFERMQREADAKSWTIDRLCSEFGDKVSLERVIGVVDGCIRDLAGTPSGAMPELCERLARQRLLDVLEPTAV